jgi:hypothetical protein
VTVRAETASTFAITEGARQIGQFVPAWPRVIVNFTIGGRTWEAVLPAVTGDVWLRGPLAHEARAVVTPHSTLTQAEHPFLRVIFDVRSFADLSHRIDVAVENALDVEAADAVTYDVAVAVSGRTVFQRKSVTHAYLARWRTVIRSNVREAEVTPDFGSFVAARALPAYLPDVSDERRRVEGPAFDILGTGDLHLPMNDHGGRPELAPYPDWTAQYLVHRRQDQRAYVLAHGDLAGSFGIHIKEPDGVQIVTIDRHPNFWLDRRADPDGRPRNNLRGQAVLADIAHQPSLAYVPYLLTGDRYYADEMKYWANYCLIGTFQDSYYNARRGAAGLLTPNEVRGIGWAIRNLGDTVYLPDVDPDRRYFAEKLQNNLEYLDQYARSFQTPLGTLFTGERPEDRDRPPYAWIALWEQIYAAWAVDHVMQHGFRPGAAFRDRIARFQLALFTSAGEGYPWRYAAPYVLAIGIRQGGNVTYFTSLGEVFRVTYGSPPAPPTSFVGYYGPEARLMLLGGVASGGSGAPPALDLLMKDGSQYADNNMRDDLRRRSGWAIAAEAGAARTTGQAFQMEQHGARQFLRAGPKR